MGGNVSAGLVQLGLAAGLFYAWWSGALAVLLEAVTAGVRASDRGDTPIADLSDTLGITSGQSKLGEQRAADAGSSGAAVAATARIA